MKTQPYQRERKRLTIILILHFNRTSSWILSGFLNTLILDIDLRRLFEYMSVGILLWFDVPSLWNRISEWLSKSVLLLPTFSFGDVMKSSIYLLRVGIKLSCRLKENIRHVSVELRTLPRPDLLTLRSKCHLYYKYI